MARKLQQSYREPVSYWTAYRQLDIEEQGLCEQYSELGAAWEKYVNAHNLWGKYYYNPRPSTGLIAIILGKNKKFYRHQAKVAYAANLERKRWEEFNLLLKLVKDY